MPDETNTPDTEAAELTPTPLPETPSAAPETDIATPPPEDAPDIVTDDPVEPSTTVEKVAPEPAVIQGGGNLPQDSAIVQN